MDSENVSGGMAMQRAAGRQLQRAGQQGIGLIEVLAALFVTAIGILAVSSIFGTYVQSTAANKATAEAMAIADSRLEEMRNYVHDASTRAEFDTLFSDMTAGNSATINGKNATFTRTETITSTGNIKAITVAVAWTDAKSSPQSISLDTELAYVAPGTPGRVSGSVSAGLLETPTGRAKLGEGQLPAGATTTPNGDGTAYYDAGDERMLVVGSKIVLTLEEACEAGTNCTDFVKIKGRLYFDKATHKGDPGEVYVWASDSSFCQRYFEDSSGNIQTVVPSTVSVAQTTPNGDYSYYDYTCYLGGGWHGNTGLLIAAGLQLKDKICQGDPVSPYAYEAPVIATRRAYRGMIYGINSSGVAITDCDADPNDPCHASGSGDTIYWSEGIADAATLTGQDFVLSEMASERLDGSNCISEGVMVRPDSTLGTTPGTLFAGNPDDFVCLNEMNELDAYDPNQFEAGATCPFDPTDPPIERHVVSGSIAITGPEDPNDPSAMVPYTSDGPGNCTVDSFSYDTGAYRADYACDVFDWGTGWEGSVYARQSQDMACTPPAVDKIALTGDSTGNDFSCFIGTVVRISGQVIPSTAGSAANYALSSVAISSVSDPGGFCSVPVDGQSYECFTGVLADPALGWSGSLTFTAPGDTVCATPGADAALAIPSNVDSPAIALGSGVQGDSEGNYTLDIGLSNNAGNCSKVTYP
jgi:Tfp pilus assembly protein PilV